MRRPSAELLFTSATRALLLIGILLALPFILARFVAEIKDQRR